MYRFNIIFADIPTIDDFNKSHKINDQYLSSILLPIFDLDMITHFIHTPEQFINYIEFRKNDKYSEEPDCLGHFLKHPNIVYKDKIYKKLLGQDINNQFWNHCLSLLSIDA